MGLSTTSPEMIQLLYFSWSLHKPPVCFITGLSIHADILCINWFKYEFITRKTNNVKAHRLTWANWQDWHKHILKCHKILFLDDEFWKVLRNWFQFMWSWCKFTLPIFWCHLQLSITKSDKNRHVKFWLLNGSVTLTLRSRSKIFGVSIPLGVGYLLCKFYQEMTAD